jgi:hypothetical protein
MYRSEDLEKIKLNINDIKDNASIIYKKNYEPTLTENKLVYTHILDFIKTKKRIIYGGWAQNFLIKNKNSDEAFYKETDVPDVEFYSYEPIKDVIELCEYLYSKGLKYIQGSQGIHEGTYKIFVNFINYCDISYLSKNICDNCPTISHNNLLYCHPYFMYIDFYRVFTDPLTSYWRLDKSFYRFLKLYEYYPFVTKNQDIIISKSDNKILSYIRKKLIHNSKYIVIGKYAYNYFVKKGGISTINIDFYEIISTNYEEDVTNILNKIKKHYSVTTKEFTPFFEFFDKRTEYYINNILVLRVYANNKKCIVYRESVKKKCLFGTFQLVYLYILSNYNYYIINKNNQYQNTYINMLINLNKAKNNYLDKNNKTVLDITPFEEFIIKCIGIPHDPIRTSYISMYNKRKKGLKTKFNYEPFGKEIKIPEYKFENSSGNEILNEKYLILK